MADQLAPSPAPKSRNHPPAAFFFILLILGWGVYLILPGLGTGSLGDFDEAQYALVARETVLHGHWLIPHESEAVPWFSKPPLNIWMTALSFKAFGINELGARFPSAVMGLLAVAACIWLGRRMTSSWYVGALAGYLLLSAPHFIWNSRVGMMDTTVVFFTCVSIAAYLRGREGNAWFLFLCGAAAGLGFLGKYLAGVLAFFILVPLALKDGVEGRVRWKGWATLLLGFVVAALPWYLYAFIQYPEGMKGMLYGDNIYDRFLVGQTPSFDPVFVSRVIALNHDHPFHHLALLACLYSWAACLRSPDKNRLLVAAWLLVGAGVLYGTRTQGPHYALPFFPGMALALTFLALDFVREKDNGVASLAMLWSAVHLLQRFGGGMFAGPVGLSKGMAVAAVLGAVLHFGPKWSAALGRPLRISLLVVLAVGTVHIHEHDRSESDQEKIAKGLAETPMEQGAIFCYLHPPFSLDFHHRKYPIEHYRSLHELWWDAYEHPGNVAIVLWKEDRETIEGEFGALPVLAEAEQVIALEVEKEAIESRFPLYVDLDCDAKGQRFLVANERGTLEWTEADGQKTPAGKLDKAPAAIALLPDGESGYVLCRDGTVETHGRAIHRGDADIPAAQQAVDIEPAFSGDGYYVLRSDGKVQSFAAPEFPGWQKPPADGMVAFSRAPSGDFWCGLTRSGWLVWTGGAPPYPFERPEPYYLGRDVQLTDRGGLVLDGFGALHPLGDQPRPVNPDYNYHDIFVALEVLPDGATAILNKTGEIYRLSAAP